MTRQPDIEAEKNATWRTLLVSGALILLTLSSVFMAFLLFVKPVSSVPWDFEYLSPMRAFVEEKDVIVNLHPLREYLTETYEKDPGVSIYFEILNTGANISISKDAEFFPASFLKLPIAMAAIKKIERGEWKWTNELVLMEGDKDDRFGDLYIQPTGSRFTIEKLIEESLVHSDNTAYYILLRNLDRDELEDVYTHLGLQDFFNRDGKISAKRYGVILRSLYQGVYLSPEDSSRVITWLTQTPFSEYLVAGLPEGTIFAHKIGVNDEESVFMDAGIVYLPERPYLIIAMVHGKSQEEAARVFSDIAKRSFTYIEKYGK